MLAIDDAVIASQNAVTASESFGIGSCYIGDVMECHDEIRALLNLPEHVFPASMVVFGYPTDKQKERIKPERVAMEHIVHENAYRTMDSAELKKMLSKNAANTTYEKWLTAFCNRKFNSDFSVEMSNSIEKYFKQFIK